MTREHLAELRELHAEMEALLVQLTREGYDTAPFAAAVARFGRAIGRAAS